jgi:hypothetical protein
LKSGGGTLIDVLELDDEELDVEELELDDILVLDELEEAELDELELELEELELDPDTLVLDEELDELLELLELELELEELVELELEELLELDSPLSSSMASAYIFRAVPSVVVKLSVHPFASNETNEATKPAEPSSCGRLIAVSSLRLWVLCALDVLSSS